MFYLPPHFWLSFLCTIFFFSNLPATSAASLQISSSEIIENNSYQIAGVYWLPDYYKEQDSRISEDPGGGDIERPCTNYKDMFEKSVVDIANKYDCQEAQIVAAQHCYTQCFCKAKYKYTKANCSGTREPSGSSCTNLSGTDKTAKYTDCTCISGYQECDGSCIPNSECCGGCPNGYYCAYGSCIDPCAGVTDIYCQPGTSCSSYGSCGECVSCAPDYIPEPEPEVPDEPAVPDEPDTPIVDPCSGVSNKICKTGYSCSSWGSCGECTACAKDQTEDNSDTKPDTCIGSSSCGGSTSPCLSSQVQTSSCVDCSGKTRYTCRAKSCSEQGKKECNGSCIALSQCCGCNGSQTCYNGSCCTPQASETNCCGTSSVSNGCGGSRTICTSKCSSSQTCSGGKCVSNKPEIDCSECSQIYGDSACVNRCLSLCKMGKNYYNIKIGNLQCAIR